MTNISTPIQQANQHIRNNISVQSLTQTPEIGLCEGVDAFAKFCQTMLLGKGSSTDEQDEDNVESSQSCNELSLVPSPVKKKHKLDSKEVKTNTTKNLKSRKQDSLNIDDEESLCESQVKDPASDEEEDEIDTSTYLRKLGPFEISKPANELPSFLNNDLNGDEGNEIQNLLHMFGQNVSKSINTKKQSTELFVNNVMKIVAKKVKGFCQKQKKARETSNDKLHTDFLRDFDGWYQVRLQKDEKVQKCIDQLKQVVKNQNDEENLRMKKIRQSYIDGIDQRKRQLDEDDNAQGFLQNQIRSDIKKLKKQMLHQSKANEVSNIRRSLQTLLSKV